jgi:hypothetical protein
MAAWTNRPLPVQANQLRPGLCIFFMAARINNGLARAFFCGSARPARANSIGLALSFALPRKFVSEPIPLFVEGSTLLFGRARGDDIGGEKVVRVRAETALRASNIPRLFLDVNKGISYDQRDMA